MSKIGIILELDSTYYEALAASKKHPEGIIEVVKVTNYTEGIEAAKRMILNGTQILISRAGYIPKLRSANISTSPQATPRNDESRSAAHWPASWPQPPPRAARSYGRAPPVSSYSESRPVSSRKDVRSSANDHGRHSHISAPSATRKRHAAIRTKTAEK